jgi:hypothetical protein
MKLLSGKVKYDEFKWKFCCDLKVVALLLGMKLGYTKYCCFLCEWDSRHKKSRYVNKLWPKRTLLTPGEKNVNPLVLPEKICAPFAQKAGASWKTLWKVWIKPAWIRICEEQVPKCECHKNQGGYIYRTPDQGTDARQIDEDLNETERNAWLSFKRICKDFLGNHKAANYEDIEQDLLTSYKAMGCNMSLKIHFL